MNTGKISFEALPRPIKYLVKIVLPKRIIKWRRSHILSSLANKSNSEIFTSTYMNYRWGRKRGDFALYSGDGSHKAEIVDGYISKVSEFLRTFNGKVILVDIGCGDFNIGSKICDLTSEYIACDVVPAVINSNKQKYRYANVKFKVLDATTETLPDGDIIILRQVLQHLSNIDILKVLRSIEHKFKYLIFTDHQPLNPNWKPNIDKQTGSNIRNEFNSGLDLTAEPFNLLAAESQIIDSVKTHDGYIRTFIYKLSI
jgi:2-polyprenyl-3-methyl-5-hydroxy-6-metoxy-1,4-benzoquinol methylase